MKALVAALNRIATALEQLVPALTQATREQHYTVTGNDWSEEAVTEALRQIANRQKEIRDQ